MIMQKVPAEVDKDKEHLDGDTAKVMCPFSKLQFFLAKKIKKIHFLICLRPNDHQEKSVRNVTRIVCQGSNLRISMCSLLY